MELSITIKAQERKNALQKKSISELIFLFHFFAFYIMLSPLSRLTHLK
jgi:hypothetical protein